MHAPFDSLEVAPELRGPLDRAHQGYAVRCSVVRLSSARASADVPSSTTSPRRAASIASTVVALGTNAPKSGQQPGAACAITMLTVLDDCQPLLGELARGFVPDLPLHVHANQNPHSDPPAA